MRPAMSVTARSGFSPAAPQAAAAQGQHLAHKLYSLFRSPAACSTCFNNDAKIFLQLRSAEIPICHPLMIIMASCGISPATGILTDSLGSQVGALVFYGRRRYVRILNAYLERNLARNGGIPSTRCALPAPRSFSIPLHACKCSAHSFWATWVLPFGL